MDHLPIPCNTFVANLPHPAITCSRAPPHGWALFAFTRRRGPARTTPGAQVPQATRCPDPSSCAPVPKTHPSTMPNICTTLHNHVAAPRGTLPRTYNHMLMSCSHVRASAHQSKGRRHVRPVSPRTQIRIFLLRPSRRRTSTSHHLQRASGKMVALSPFDADPIQKRRFRGLKAIPTTIHVSPVAVVPTARSRSASRTMGSMHPMNSSSPHTLQIDRPITTIFACKH